MHFGVTGTGWPASELAEKYQLKKVQLEKQTNMMWTFGLTSISFAGCFAIFCCLTFPHAVAAPVLVLVCVHSGRGHVSTLSLSSGWIWQGDKPYFQMWHVPAYLATNDIQLAISQSWSKVFKRLGQASRVRCNRYSWLQQRLFTEESIRESAKIYKVVRFKPVIVLLFNDLFFIFLTSSIVLHNYFQI